ncbi:PLP-dependent transferase [Lacunisphaera limnophila]|nr:PLP-dependent transferase [Lacunisphaera limnophila]
MSSAYFPPLPLGQSIPASPHAVSCSLPTMHAVRGYEEKDPAIVRQLTNGYPRFVLHPFTRRLVAHLTTVTPALRQRTLWLTSSGAMAQALLAHLTPARGAELYTLPGLHGVSHPESPETAALAKVFLQNLGGFLSSREAEDHLVALQLLPAPHPEEVFAGDAPAEIRRQLRTVLPGTTDADLLLASCGMSAMHAAFRAVNSLQAPRGRTVWLQLGWLYLDTIAILKKFTAHPADYVYVREVADLDALRRIFAAHGARIAGVVTEVPTNPLIQTPDLPAIAALCREHGARLLVDPSMSSVFSLDVLPHADLVVSSLTKYTASEGDLTAGLVAVNPAAPAAAALRSALAGTAEPLYARDAARLAWQIGQTPAVLARIQAATPSVVAFLEKHPAVKAVFWALQSGSRENYLKLARTPDATGGMITFTLRNPGGLEKFYDRLRLPKGPSFGMKTTLICPFMYLAHYDLVTTPAGLAELAASRLDPDLLRLCVGTEPVDEIIRALSEALA